MFGNTKTFPFTLEGLEEAKKWKPWYMRKETYTLTAMTVAYIAVLVASNGSVASMGVVEDSLIKAFKINSVVGGI